MVHTIYIIAPNLALYRQLCYDIAAQFGDVELRFDYLRTAEQVRGFYDAQIFIYPARASYYDVMDSSTAYGWLLSRSDIDRVKLIVLDGYDELGSDWSKPVADYLLDEQNRWYREGMASIAEESRAELLAIWHLDLPCPDAWI